MKNRFKSHLAVMLVLLLMFTSVPFSFADSVSHSLNEDNTVSASYDSETMKLVISGHGSIDPTRWREFVYDEITAASYLFRGFRGRVSDVEIIATDGLKIKLPEDSSYFFHYIKGNVSGLANLDTSDVKIMAEMFAYSDEFNAPIDSWDTSNVTDMREMFYGAHKFNQPLNSWNVDKVQDMSSMFYSALDFNQPLNQWNTSSVENMSSMFFAAKSFNQPLDRWDVSSVGDMTMMFAGATSFNQPLNSWDFSSLESAYSMLQEATAYNQSVNWTFSKIPYISSMFFNATAFEQAVTLNFESALSDEDRLDLSLVFANTGVKSVTINGSALEGELPFLSCPKLAYLEIEDFATELDFAEEDGEPLSMVPSFFEEGKIYTLNTERLFADDYTVEVVGGEKQDKSYDAPTEFDEDTHYKVYLQQLIDLDSCTLAPIDDQVHTGEAIVPNFLLTDDGYILEAGVDYDIVAQQNNIEVGQASLTLRGTEKIYTGEKTVSFNIVSTDGGGDDNGGDDGTPDANAPLNITKRYVVGATMTDVINLMPLLPAGADLANATIEAQNNDNGILQSTTAGAITVDEAGIVQYQLSGQGDVGDSATATLELTLANHTPALLTVELNITLIADPATSEDDDDDEEAGEWIVVGDTTGDDADTQQNETQEEVSSPEANAEAEQPTVQEATETRFSDVPASSWYDDAVQFVVQKGLMKGVSATLFKPQLELSRAMLVTMLYRMSGAIDGGAGARFSDVVADSWYSAAVNWADGQRVARGFGDGTFRPNQLLTREQLVLMLYRYAALRQYSMTLYENLDRFSDRAEIAPYALDAMRWAVQNDIIKGTGITTLSPKAITTRAQMATIMMRFAAVK